MSCVFVIVPVVAAGWPLICSMAGVAAGAMGYRKLSQAANYKQIESEAEKKSGIELADENSKLGLEGVAEGQSLSFEREGMRIEISRDHRGRLKIHVAGKGKSDTELRQEGERFVAQVRKQFAYQKVMEEMRKKGFSLVQEEAVEGRIKLKVRKIS